MELSPFRLESLRKLREHAEACAKLALAAELAAGEQRREDLRDAEAALAQARHTPGDGEFLSGYQLAAHDAFVVRREREKLVAQQWTVAQDRRISDSRDALAGASRARSAFERLKERVNAAHVAEQQRREEAVLGEVALTRHVRAAARA